MPVEIRVPMLGESVVEATVGRWLRQVGEAVAVGEPVVELETEKVNVEVPADEAGVLEQVARREGETVRPGDVLGTIRREREVPPKPAPAAAALPTPEAVPAAPPAAAAPPGAEAAPPAPPAAEVPPAAAPAAEAAPPAAEAAPLPAAAEREKVRAAPLVQRLAAQLGVDLERVPGSGPGGRVTTEDVLAYTARTAAQAAAAGAAPAAPSAAPPAAAPGAPPPAPARPPAAEGAAAVPAPSRVPTAATPPPAAAAPPVPFALLAAPAVRPETRQRLSRRRLTIARRLVEAQRTAAMLTTFNEIDMSAVVALRQRRRDAFRERHGVSLGYMPFFVKAAVGALKAFPQVNAELQGEDLILKHYYDVGIAIGDPEGLVVPVLRDVDRLTFGQIEQAIAGFVQRARDRKLTLEELQGGTFTITNGGVYGSLLSTPILNPPQVGILGMHKIEDRPVAAGGQVVIRPMMYVALSYDHRVVDGREAVLFLVRIKELIEDPERLLLEA